VIQALGLFLPSPDLSIGIFLRVIGHFWQQVRVIEGFSLLLEHGILQLESLAFRSTCIDLHFLFRLWRHYFVLAGAFCSSNVSDSKKEFGLGSLHGTTQHMRVLTELLHGQLQPISESSYTQCHNSPLEARLNRCQMLPFEAKF
jgi:hypothetical protein